VVCAQVITEYCSCDGETKTSNNSCIFDRFAHKGACNKFCGGIAGIPCPAGQKCVDNPNDSCNPNLGGADCGGMCVPDTGGCPPVMCTLFCANGFKKGPDGCPICSCNEEAGNSCKGRCGKPSADKSCYCDKSCKSYGDCCADYEDECGTTRTPASGQCVKNSNDACSTDADCTGGGCGGELCYNPDVSSGISTCECTAPTNVKGCGCVSGKCTWYN
jgi:hypothetical protein